MGKIKVHELAKQLGLESKELIEKLANIGILDKKALSVLSDDEMIKVNNSDITKSHSQNSKKVEHSKEVTKKENPIIIRREVQVVNNEKQDVETNTNTTNKSIGFVERNQDHNFNLMNRNKEKKQVSSIADLFKKPEPVKPVQKEEIKKEEKVEEKIMKTEEVEIKKPEVQQNKTFETRTNNNFNNRPNNNFNNNRNNSTTNGNNNNFVRKPNNFNNNQGTGNNSKFNPKPNINKDIKNVITASPAGEKEVSKDFATKQFNNKPINHTKQSEEVRKHVPAKKGSDSSLDVNKLKDLKTQNTLSTMFKDSNGGMLDYYDMSNNRNRNKKNKKGGNNRYEPRREYEKNKIFELTEITIPDTISVKDFAEKMKKTTSEVIKKLLGLGIMATMNQEIDFDTAFLIATEFGITANKAVVVTHEDILFDDETDNEKDLKPRAPVVVVMGHVDHGKTSLLDAIRSTNVMDGEHGGITQHIGAYKVKINDRDITFLDTPGHEAFTAMRARGAMCTDIAILVVAADDGIMPQTIEAINHAKAAETPIIVAINKIDKDGANVERVKQALTEYELVPEEWGGDTICVPISAKQKIGIENLLEMVLLVADMKNLRANPNKQSKGTVIESRLDKNKGIIASLLVQRGTLNVGDTIIVGDIIGKIRVLLDDKGKNIKSAGPSTPVEVIGLPEAPIGGEIFYEVENEKVAKQLMEKRKSAKREKELKANSCAISLDDLFGQMAKCKMKYLNIIVKADVQGSVEALKQSLLKIESDEVNIRVIHANVGAISQSDVTLAKVSNAIIIGFNVRPDNSARAEADDAKVDIRLYSVIYHAIEDIEKALKGMLDPKYKETALGTAEVRSVFKVTNVGAIAGCYVVDGKIARNAMVRVIRDNIVVHEGKLSSLKRFKDDAKEVATGYECGIQVDSYNDIKELDKIECYILEQIKQ